MLTMAVCIASSERSFSKLKLILSYLQASMTNNNSGQVVWSSFDVNKKRRKSEKLLDDLCFHKRTESVVLISFFV